LLMVVATLLFSVMGVAVKYALEHYSAGELVFYRSAIGAVMIGGYAHWRGVALRSPVLSMHAWRCGSMPSKVCRSAPRWR
jgi:S-adenosylmethionine uptake transporter